MWFRILFEEIDIDAKCTLCGKIVEGCTIAGREDKVIAICKPCLKGAEVARTPKEIDLNL